LSRRKCSTIVHELINQVLMLQRGHYRKKKM
jgi:hypothetical protein